MAPCQIQRRPVTVLAVVVGSVCAGVAAAEHLGLQLRHLPLQLLQAAAGARQHRALHVDFLAPHQVQTGKRVLHGGAQVALEVLLQAGEARGHGVADAAGQVVEDLGVHGGYSVSASKDRVYAKRPGGA